MIDVIFTAEFQERFWARVNKNAANGCWEWTGKPSRGRGKIDGYGRVKVGGRKGPVLRAHRVAFALSGHELVEGLVLDHLCRNRLCVNPAHLDQVTDAVNIARGFQARGKTTRCRHGHERTVANTYINTRGYQECRACRAVKSEQKREGKPHPMRSPEAE